MKSHFSPRNRTIFLQAYETAFCEEGKCIYAEEVDARQFNRNKGPAIILTQHDVTVRIRSSDVSEYGEIPSTALIEFVRRFFSHEVTYLEICLER